MIYDSFNNIIFIYHLVLVLKDKYKKPNKGNMIFK